MAADTISPTVLEYIDHGAYPESEAVASAELGPDALADLLAELRKAQDEVKDEIRSLSRNVAPDIDTWITRARELHSEIERSRETARQIVVEAEAGRDLRATVEDAGKKTELLEKEVSFNETLAGTLDHMRHVSGLLDGVQDAAVKGNVQSALNRLDDVESSLGGLQVVQNTRAYGLLEERAKNLKDNLAETTTEFWNSFIQISHEEKRLTVRKEPIGAFVPGAQVSDIDLGLVVTGAKGLSIFDGLVQRLGRDADRVLLRPRLVMDRDGQLAKVSTSDEELSCSRDNEDTGYGAMFNDLHTIFDFLATRLPPSIGVPLSDTLMPALTTRLEEHWLEPAVPLDIADMPAFQQTLSSVLSLVEHIDRLGWHGSKQLKDWVQSAPRTWLTKRREAVLGDVRRMVFVGLKDTKTVERVETQMLSKADSLFAARDGGDDEWDTAWDEPEEQTAQPASRGHAAPEQKMADGEDGNAWATEDGEDEVKEGGTGEDDAWGWGDEEASQQLKTELAAQRPTPSKVNGDGPAADKASAEREMTLRETFMVTSVPEHLLSIVKSVISDAESLAGPDYALSPIAPAATALYTLPTLALAIYRATASTAYSKLPTGNMLIYNDSLHLASQLREWQASQPPASRLKVDNDVKTLETFAKRAYSSEMDSQRTILGDLLDGAQGFSNCTVPPFKAECESAVEQTVHRLQEVHRQWQDVLPRSALLQSLGSLLAHVTGKMINEIEDLGDISEADSHQLKRLMDRVVGVTALFRQQQPEGGGEAADMTFIYCPNWFKFQYLAEILESNLADIKYLWNEAELSLEFEAEEVVELIEALFAESDLRRRAIAEIRRGGRR